ncbi:unnamed protein product, partial [Linum tenue]
QAKEEAKRAKQLERAEKNRLAAIQKQQQRAAKAAAKAPLSQPNTVQLMPDGTTRRPRIEASQQPTQGCGGSQNVSQVTQEHE